MTGSQDYNQAWAYVAALTQADPATCVIDARMIHDQKKDIPAIPLRGALPELWNSITSYNNQGYGAFVNISDMDGVGRETGNVRACRVAVVDLDNLSAKQNFDRAAAWSPPPTFGVQSSPTKFHCYWSVPYFAGNDLFTLRQRKLAQLFDGDKRIIDAARVLRLPGTLHLKAEPFLVNCFALSGYGQIVSHEALDGALAAVNVIDGGHGARHDLGEPSLAAPSLDWLKYGLELCDPNDLDRGEWIALSAAIKQAGWSLTDPDTLYGIWSDWCARYAHNDTGENLKQWTSIRNSELGWQSMVRRIPSLTAAATFGGVDRSAQVPGASPAAAPTPSADPPPMPTPPALDCSGEFLTHIEQQQWFKGCVFIVNRGDMLTPDGRFLGPSQFNGAYGGKQFIIDTVGKKTNEAWQAATRSTLWTVPKVDHVRFMPSRPFGEIITDDLGRAGVNTYRPINVNRLAGDATPFLAHIAALLPNAVDQKIILDFLAHNAKYPGHKIPWAPVIQSAEGAGKGVLKAVMTHVMGRPYVHFPNAKELSSSGSQFNAWMRNKLFLLADEIKVDDRRDLIEVLKPMISEELIEVQGKGVDQDLEDNFANWCFFTNWKDAIPVTKNGRRFAIFYSPLQTAEHLISAGMDGPYFTAMYDWLKGEKGYQHGAAIVADFLLNYPIERGAVPMRAPDTTSTAAAVDLSRGPVERMISEAVEDGLQGFRGGWVSATAVAKRIKETGTVRHAIQPQTIGTILEGLGYVSCGRAARPYFQEDVNSRAYLYHRAVRADVAGYGPAQGYAE